MGVNSGMGNRLASPNIQTFPQGQLTAATLHDQLAQIANLSILAGLPAHFERDVRWTGGASTSATTRRTIVSPNLMTININNVGYVLSAQTTLDLNTAGSWDTTSGTDYTTAAKRAGKDFYIYACTPSSGTIPDIKISVNSTTPTGYSATTSRKIGGFHCLCLSVGTISGHTLTGYLTGDILPLTVWDLNWCSSSIQEGFLRSADGKWKGIYLPSVSNGQLVSVFGGTIADGVSATAFHWYKFAEWFRRIGQRMLFQDEFFTLSMGSNQGTNITGSADPNTTGGHTDTAGRRMISNEGAEDCCGVMWQWGMDSLSGGSDAWANAYDGNDTGVGGQHYRPANRVILGGGWGDGVLCGSRGSSGVYGPLALDSDCGSRGCAEPKEVKP